MTLHLGNVPAGSTLYIPFASYNAAGASITLSGLAVTDIEIYKNGSVTQRASDAGYTLLDTDGIDFDGITGIHGFSIDLSNNTDAGFYTVGSFYWVVVSSVTVDSQVMNFVAATFRIIAAEHTAGYVVATIKDGTGTGELDTASGVVLAKDHTGANLATEAAAASILADTDELQTDWVNGGRLDNILDARASQASVDAVDDFVDTEVAAIKAKTDQLTFTVANQIDANIQSVNDVTVTGDGQPGTEWGP